MFVRNNTKIPYIHNLILTQSIRKYWRQNNSDTTNTNLNLCAYMYFISYKCYFQCEKWVIKLMLELSIYKKIKIWTGLLEQWDTNYRFFILKIDNLQIYWCFKHHIFMKTLFLLLKTLTFKSFLKDFSLLKTLSQNEIKKI